MAKQSKGAQYERTICKELSMWWTQDLDTPRDDIFWRSSNSGGRATTRAKQGKTTSGHDGDIACIDQIGKPLIDTITIECKRGYANKTIHDLFDAPSSAKQQMYDQWFQQVITAHQHAHSYSWMLITKRDRREPLVFMPIDLYTATVYGEPFPYINFIIKIATGQELNIAGIPWQRWLEQVKPDQILHLYDLYKKGNNDRHL